MTTQPLPTKARIVVLVSGQGTNLQALIDAAAEAEYPGQIVAVGSNRPDAYALERAQQANIDTFAVDHERYDERAVFDAELLRRINSFTPDLIVLAGFMRILTKDFVRYFRGRLLNIHPSLLPRYQGLHTHKRALEAGDKEHGTTIHFVTEELDGGPAIAQAEVPVLENDTTSTLGARVQAREHILYPIIVRWFCEGRITLALGEEVALFDGDPMPALLTLPAETYN